MAPNPAAKEKKKSPSPIKKRVSEIVSIGIRFIISLNRSIFSLLNGEAKMYTSPGFSIGNDVKVNLEFSPATIKAAIPILM